MAQSINWRVTAHTVDPKRLPDLHTADEVMQRVSYAVHAFRNFGVRLSPNDPKLSQTPIAPLGITEDGLTIYNRTKEVHWSDYWANSTDVTGIRELRVRISYDPSPATDEWLQSIIKYMQSNLQPNTYKVYTNNIKTWDRPVEDGGIVFVTYNVLCLKAFYASSTYFRSQK